MPSECHGCIFEDRVGGCIILNKTGVCGKSYEEYDDEWHRAHKEHRRLKWCPIEKVEECPNCIYSYPGQGDTAGMMMCKVFGRCMTPVDYCSRGRKK